MGFLNGKGLSSKYLKEGKGVEKNAPQKRGFFAFLDILFDKALDLIRLNVLYSLFSILWLVFLYVRMIQPVQMMLGALMPPEQISPGAVFGFCAMFTLLIFNFWGCAPIAPSFAYVTRSFTRHEPVWVWSDGWDIFKANIKQSVVIFIIDILVVIMAPVAITLYAGFYGATGSYLWFMMLCLTGLTLFLYTIMHYYLYQIMVTFECSVMQLLKYSLLCALANLPMTLILPLIGIFVMFVLPLMGVPMEVILIFQLTVGLCITRFPLEFHAARVIKKLIRTNEKKAAKNKAKITYIEEDSDGFR